MAKKFIYNWDSLPVALDVETVAVILGINMATVYKMANSGELKGKKFGKLWRFDKDELRGWLNAD